MPITIGEKIESRKLTSGDSASCEYLYVITGTSDAFLAGYTLGLTAPATYLDLVLKDTSVEPVYVDVSNPDRCIWEGSAKYCLPEQKDKAPGEGNVSFDTTGGTQHITQSRKTVRMANKDSVKEIGTAGGGPFGGAICVSENGPEGVDITVPVYKCSEMKVFTEDQVTNEYRGVLFNLTGKVNGAAFKGFAAGECLFLGASGSKRGDGKWEITFNFAGSPNATAVKVGDLAPVNKKGWEYLWVVYGKKVVTHPITEAKMMVDAPTNVVIDQVYDEGDFSTLAIGT